LAKKNFAKLAGDAAKKKTVTLADGTTVKKTPNKKGVDKVVDKGNGKTKTVDHRGGNKKVVEVTKDKGDGDSTVTKKVVRGGDTKKTVTKKFDDGYLVSKETDKKGNKNDVVHDQSGEIARMLEDQRRAKINSGEGLINDAFSVFNPAFFNKYRQDYTNHYNPQVDKQFGDARQGLKYNLARARTQDSTQGQRNFGDLIEEYGKRRAEIGSNAISATNTYKSNIDQQKQELYNQNQLAADPTKAAQSAVGRVGALQTTPTYSPIGDLFSGLIRGGTAYLAGRQQGLPAGYSV
jgi:hypothetical protein